MTTPIDRRRLALRQIGAAGLLLSLGPWARAATAVAAPTVEVWKGPACECCEDWMTHLRANGLRIGTVHATGNADIRQRMGLPVTLGSCHTGVVAGYALEGHVPAREVLRLLREKPPGVVGLAVPAMPIGSPGMDGPAYGGQKDPFDVLLVLKNGSHRVYQSYS
jgi:hypothetical protein